MDNDSGFGKGLDGYIPTASRPQTQMKGKDDAKDKFAYDEYRRRLNGFL